MAYGDNIFTAMISEDGTIYEASTGRKRQAVGVDSQKEQELLNQIAEMQETLDSWRPKMIEHGYIKEPKTPEQIAQEAADEQIKIAQEQAAQQAEINQALLEAITNLKSELKELKSNGDCRNSIEPSIEPMVGENSEGNRKVGRPSKGSNTASVKSSARNTK